MKIRQPLTGGLNDDDRAYPERQALVDFWLDVDLFDALRFDAYAVRNELFTDLTEKAGISGPNRGLTARITRALGLSDWTTKSVKLRAKKRREEGPMLTDRETHAIMAAVRAAAETYRTVMANSADDSDGRAA